MLFKSQSYTVLAITGALLALAGCSNANSGSSVQAAANGKTVSYLCSDSQRYSVRYYQQGASDLAELRMPDGQRYTLAQVVSGSGAKYLGDIYEWWSKGDSAYFTNLLADSEAPLECQVSR